MNIAVLIKQVPVSNDVSVDPETHALVRARLGRNDQSSGLERHRGGNGLKRADRRKSRSIYDGTSGCREGFKRCYGNGL